MIHSMAREMVNGKWCIYTAPLTKALYIDCALHSPIHTHTYTDSGGNHARHQPAHLEQLGVQRPSQVNYNNNTVSSRISVCVKCVQITGRFSLSCFPQLCKELPLGGSISLTMAPLFLWWMTWSFGLLQWFSNVFMPMDPQMNMYHLKTFCARYGRL